VILFLACTLSVMFVSQCLVFSNAPFGLVFSFRLRFPLHDRSYLSASASPFSFPFFFHSPSLLIPLFRFSEQCPHLMVTPDPQLCVPPNLSLLLLHPFFAHDPSPASGAQSKLFPPPFPNEEPRNECPWLLPPSWKGAFTLRGLSLHPTFMFPFSADSLAFRLRTSPGRR